ncbi:YicC/YloC family endoribonuclease [Marinicrinis sediminis]|uniref:YicC/YloC family endoribonuclease n=1 Tax=Marinicrinis sediminis TaxID=1652465 RepID=A0ABW5R5B3_9BACL
MIRSMTGFGQAERLYDAYQIKVEMKSVNHRYLEVNVRSGKEWLEFEEVIRKTIQQQAKRGRFDVYLSVEQTGQPSKRLNLDWDLADQWMQIGQEAEQRYGRAGSLHFSDLLKLPDLYQIEEGDTEDPDRFARELELGISEALAHLLQMREAEGKHLQQELAERVGTLRTVHADIRACRPQVLADTRSRLHHRLQELLSDSSIEEHRFAMEIALLAERSDITEELTRLESHFEQFDRLLQADEPVGRKMDFLIQEMNREVNTIGSKSNAIQIAEWVVDLKSELEKIREQVQNIE